MGTVTAVFNRVEVNNNNEGITVNGGTGTGTINATVSESVAAGNHATGFFVVTSSGHTPISLTVFHSVAANSGSGIEAANPGATLTIAQSMVTGNSASGWFVTNSAVIQSYGDNYFNNNGANTGSLTPVSKQ
jgi:hypothetical protein